MSFSVNTSPFAGQEGSQLTSNMIKDRLTKEAETNVSMMIVESENKESFEVRGRGELQLGILIENMRREGYELSVSAPRVVFKREGDAVLEPLEEVVIDVGQEHTGQVIEKMSGRKGELQDFIQSDDGKARLKFKIPMRGLIGYRSELQNDTRGQGIMNNIFHSYVPFMGDLDKSDKGALISSAEGTITSFALEGLEARGVLFVEPGMKTYSGMVIGEHNREGDLEVNPAKVKALSNVRSVTKEEKTKLTPPRTMSLEEVIAYVRDDEIIEVTGKSIRLRKIELDGNKRKAVSGRTRRCARGSEHRDAFALVASLRSAGRATIDPVAHTLFLQCASALCLCPFSSSRSTAPTARSPSEDRLKEPTLLGAGTPHPLLFSSSFVVSRRSDQ